MHRIDGPGHDNNMFTEGVPPGVPATVVTEDWLNAVQEEIVNVILDAGITLDKPTNTQLRDAVNALLNPLLPLASLAVLRALPVPTQTVARDTLGYYVAGDNGHGRYRWNASDTRADNGGTVIQPDSLPGTGRWNLLI